MNNLTTTQKMRSELLERNSYDVKNAKACYDFVMGGEDASQDKTDTIANGIYLMQNDGSAVLYTGQSLNDAEKSKCTGIGIKLGCKSIVVGMRDTVDDDTELTTETGGTRFITSYQDAVADWAGRENTEDIRSILHPSAMIPESMYIPSLGEWYFILLHFKAVNEALVAAGGEAMRKDWYWSSTQHSAADAWYLGLSGGYASYSTKATIQIRVRPVSAFLPLNS